MRHMLRAAAVLWAAAACHRAADSDPLEGGAGSLHGLAERFVTAVSAGDTAAMHRLRVTQHEHNDLLWPHFPASRLNMPVDYAWEHLNLASRRDASRIVKRYAGVHYELRDVQCRKGVTMYQAFRIHGDCALVLVSANDTVRAKFFGSAVEWDGRFKAVGILED